MTLHTEQNLPVELAFEAASKAPSDAELDCVFIEPGGNGGASRPSVRATGHGGFVTLHRWSAAFIRDSLHQPEARLRERRDPCLLDGLDASLAHLKLPLRHRRPAWAGGRIQSINYNFDAKRLVVGLSLDGSGPPRSTPHPQRTYQNGFVATSSSGARFVYDGTQVLEANGMSWDAAAYRVVLPAQTGSVTVTVEPRV